jgi:uncharacterized membrane protein
MLRKQLIENGEAEAAGSFRLRGAEVTRVEGFSDCVLGFALTLLVVSLEVPATFDEMLRALAGFAAFGVCFIFLIYIWYSHYRFFRRYGLQDSTTIFLNAALLFVVVLFVYPLKFLFSNIVVRPAENGAVPIRPDQVPQLFVLYGLGFAAVFIIFILMYANAYRHRSALELTPAETFDTLNSILGNAVFVVVPLISIGIALLVSSDNIALAGWVYFLIPVLKTIQGTVMGAHRRERFGPFQVR